MASYNCGGQVAFDFRLPAGQVEFSGLFLTLKGSLTVWALYAYFSYSQNAAFELLVWCM